MDPRLQRDAARLSERARTIDQQKIRLMFDLAERAEREGADLVHLEIGEPDFATPEHVVTAATEAAAQGKTKYTANAGIAELREALAEKLGAEMGFDVDPASEVAVTTGGVEAYHLAMHAVADPGDEVVVPTPTWPNPISQAKLADAVPVQVPMPAAAGFAPDPDRIVDAIGPDTAAVVVTTPSNPTGQLFDREAIRRVVAAAADHGAYVIADEVYRELVYADPPPPVARVVDREHEDWVLSLNSFSKTYAMTGWRVGWLSGPADVIGAITKLHESTTSCVTTPAQHAAVAALRGPREPIDEMKAAFRERRAFVIDRIGAIPHVSLTEPDGAFYAFVDVSALPGTSMEIAKRLLHDYGVVTAPGVAFGEGGEGHLRVSFANGRDRLALGLDRFEAMVRAAVD
jgi:aspartate aminotransferase